MKRRNALHVLAALGIGSIAMPGCNFKDEILDLTLGQIQLSKNQQSFIQSLSDVILPKGDLLIETPESFPDFLRTQINDCSSQEEIEKYGLGYQAYKTFLKEQFSVKLEKLDEGKIEEIFSALNNQELITPNASFFYSRTKDLAMKHLVTSKYYMQEFDQFEFIPGRYNGCVAI